MSESAASDLVQDVFLVLVQKLPEFQYDSKGSFRAWLKTVTLNKWRQRFLREARAAAAFEHDHLVTIYRVGEHGRLPYFAMQLLSGETLAGRIKRVGKLPPDLCLGLARQIASGLAAAHEHGIVHRDIKPENVWFEAGETGDRVRILDFGLAHVTDEGPCLTDPGTVAGTPAYMAPEQARGEAVDHRADLFSLGCVLYEMCTGRAPFVSPTTASTLVAVLQHQPRPPHEADPGVPRPLSSLVMRLLEKDRTRRIQSAREVLIAIDRCGQPEPPRRRRSRGWLPGIAAAGAALVFLAGIIITVTTRDRKVVIEVDEPDPQINIKLTPTAPAAGNRCLAGHTGAVLAVAFSRDGRLAVTGGKDALLRLWDVATGRQIRIFTGHTDAVRTAAFSPDGKLVVSSGEDGTLRLWDVADGHEIRKLEGHTDKVFCAVFCPDGAEVLSGSWDQTVRLWDVATGDLMKTFAGHTTWVRSVDVSPDGRWGLSGGNDALVLVWDLKRGKLVHRLQGHRAPVGRVAFAQDSRLAISSGWDHTIRLWDVAREKEIRILEGGAGTNRHVALVPRSTWAIAAGSASFLQLWDLQTGDFLERLQGHTTVVCNVAVSCDGRMAISGGEDKTARLWPLPQPKQTAELRLENLKPLASPR